jgi:hypothetical protein
MKRGIIFYFIIISLFIGMSCTDKDDPKSAYDSQRILECHNKQTWGLEETGNKIIGQWEWKHAEYVYAIPPGNDFKGMKIEFRDDWTGTLTYSQEAPAEFTWSIGTYNIYFGFTTEPLIPQLNGHIFFCDNIMLCGVAGSGIADGVNNYFQKIQ